MTGKTNESIRNVARTHGSVGNLDRGGSGGTVDSGHAEVLKCEAEVNRLTDLLRAARDRLEAAKRKVAGIEVGMIVYDRQGVKHKVTRVQMWGPSQRPWVSGHRLKVDGYWGRRENHLYDQWTVVEGPIKDIPMESGRSPALEDPVPRR